MAGDHDFARFLKTIGRGPTLSRPLGRDEAYHAMALILAGAVEPVQIGAFLLVLRHRGETAEELGGLVEAARATLALPADPPTPDLDWPSYADRHRQQPWFVLAALLLAENGVKILMHGIAGLAEGHAPTRPALAAFGITPCRGPAEAARRLESENLVYLGLEQLCPALDRLFALRPLLGVRTAVNSLSRALNPLRAPSQIQGVFHPPYRVLHQEAALADGQPRAAIFKGGGGECQRNPQKPCRVAWVRDGRAFEEDWPALLPGDDYRWRDEPLGREQLTALWRGEITLPAPEAMITGTVALALVALGRAEDPGLAQAAAEALWRDRPRQKIPADRAVTA